MSAEAPRERGLGEEVRRAAPREHGAWGILGVPLLVGAGCGGRPGPALAWVVGGALALFLFRGHLAAGLRARRYGRPLPARLPLLIGTDALLGAVCGGVLLGVYHLRWLLPLGGVGLLLLAADALWLSRRQERSLAAELSGAAALCLGAPAAYLTAGGRDSWLAAGLWLMCVAYFWAAIPYVRMRIARRLHPELGQDLPARLRSGRPALVAHAVALAAAVGAAAAGLVPPLAVVALVPAAVRAAVGALRVEERVPVRVLGWMEVVHSLIFAGLLVTAVRF